MKLTRHDKEAPILSQLPSRLLGRTGMLVGRVVSAAMAAQGTHRHQFAILATLEAFGPASQAELCRRTDLDRSDMNISLNALESEGSVKRAIDAANRRQKIVELTEYGRRRFADLSQHLEAAQSEAFGILSKAERAELMRLLRRVHGHLASELTPPDNAGSKTGAS